MSGKAPIYIVTGAGGSREGYSNSWVVPAPANSAFRETIDHLDRFEVADSASLSSGNVGIFGFGLLEFDFHQLKWEYFTNSNQRIQKLGAAASQPVLIDSVTLKR